MLIDVNKVFENGDDDIFLLDIVMFGFKKKIVYFGLDLEFGMFKFVL